MKKSLLEWASEHRIYLPPHERFPLQFAYYVRLYNLYLKEV